MESKYQYHLERMEHHRKELEKIMAYGEDDFIEGTILYFEKCFVERGTRSKRYKYCAMKNRGQWYTCGPRSPGPYSWDALVSFMSDGVKEVYVQNPERMTLSQYRSGQDDESYHEYGDEERQG